MNAVEVIAQALERPQTTRVPFGQRRTLTLAAVAVQALYEAGFRIVREPEFEHE